jgi:hypothetical protein
MTDSNPDDTDNEEEYFRSCIKRASVILSVPTEKICIAPRGINTFLIYAPSPINLDDYTSLYLYCTELQKKLAVSAKFYGYKQIK